MKKTVQHDGFLALWRGNSAQIVRYFPLQAINLSLKDKFKRAWVTKRKDGYAKFCATSILAGGCAGAMGMTIVYPLDFVQTRLQADIGSKSEK